MSTQPPTISPALLAIVESMPLQPRSGDLLGALVRAEAAGRASADSELAAALAGLVKAYEEVQSDTECRDPSADHGCIECTLGTVPNHLNTGLCAYHRAQQLLAAKRITVTRRVPGYKHEQLEGTCAADVTVEEIRSRFYDQHFGGRDAWVKDGRWGAVVHTD